MGKLGNYILNKWVEGQGEGTPLFNAVDGSIIGYASTEGLDFRAVVDYARTTGNRNLRKMTFHERGRMIKALAVFLNDRREIFYDLNYLTGATRADGWIDIEGGIGNLFSYASLRRKFPDETYYVEGAAHILSKGQNFIGQHILVPKEGTAIHINAFNFPVWGMLEKCAVNWLAGLPAIVKPATVTSFLTEAVVREIDKSGILPEGALQLLCGSAGSLLDFTSSQDVVTFTGSAATGLKLKSHPNILKENVSFNMEADSLNCIVLGEDVFPGSAEWDIFIKEVRKEMTVKAGQKCTAIRRIFVPGNKMEDAWKAIGNSLSQTVIGNPKNEKVRMGSLAGQDQRQEVMGQVKKLMSDAELVYGSLGSIEVLDADAGKGAFISPLLLMNKDPFHSHAVHEVEAFGPVSTIMPYKSAEEAVELSKLGKGSLCSTIVTNDKKQMRDYALGAGTHHGRILILNADCAKESTGHGSPLPVLIHGGPGRAGGGEEMGGMRGVYHYMQRVAIQGSPSAITAVTNVYQQKAEAAFEEKHPFRKYYEELEIGDALATQKRTITEADISNFANLSWDHFYAHTDHTALEGTLFEKPVAHGYLILSAAAGLFVDGRKGPVLLNYGLEECRFLKPVYAGTTISVQLTCKEKVPQDKKEPDDIPRGIVKWLVEVADESGELVALATILTVVRKLNQ